MFYKMLIVLFLAGCASYPSDHATLQDEEITYSPRRTFGAPPMVRAQMRGTITQQEYRVLPSYMQDYYERD